MIGTDTNAPNTTSALAAMTQPSSDFCRQDVTLIIGGLR